MHKTTPPLAAASLAAFLVLAGCGDSEPEVVGGMYDPNAQENETAEANGDVELPPMERDSRSYRCADNSIVYVTFFTGDTQVTVATERGGSQTVLSSEASAEPADAAAADAPAEPAEAEGPVRFTGGGYTLVGTGSSVQFARPGGSLQRCNA